jgi:hypothetical protein
LEQVSRSELLQLMDFVLVAIFAGKHIIRNGCALRAKSALTVFAHANGGGGGVVEAVQIFSIPHLEQARSCRDTTPLQWTQVHFCFSSRRC